MKKFSELRYVKLNLPKIQQELGSYIDAFEAASSFEQQNAIMKKLYKYCDQLSTNITIATIHYSIDTRDKKYQKAQDMIDEVGPHISALLNRYGKALVQSKFRKQLEEKWGSHLFNMTDVSLRCFDEKIIPEMQEINRLTSEYTKLIASAAILYKGETMNLSQLSKYAQDKDPIVRKEAALLQASFFADKEAEIGAIYDKLVKTRHQMATKLGFKNFVQLGYFALGRTDYDSEKVKNYREQIYQDLVPFTQKLLKEQMKRLHEKKPQFYDYNVAFLSGNATPKGNKDFLVSKAKTMYAELSKETDVFFDFLCTYELLDLEAKEGKSPGGYMTYLPKYKAPFIFSNFNGTAGDVDVLTHEFGHAFQGYMSRNIVCPDYRMPTLEACEIHSMSMEFITHPWMHLFFEEDTKKYQYSHTVDAICFIPYGVTIDEFQHWVYEHPEANHQERCDAFRAIEKKYLPHRQYAEAPVYEHGGWWMKQSHVFGSPFYYIDYTLAQIVAFQFFNEDRANHDRAWKKYVKLCKMGGKYPFTVLLEKAKLYNPFVDGTVKKVVKPLKKYLASFQQEELI